MQIINLTLDFVYSSFRHFYKNQIKNIINWSLCFYISFLFKIMRYYIHIIMPFLYTVFINVVISFIYFNNTFSSNTALMIYCALLSFYDLFGSLAALVTTFRCMEKSNIVKEKSIFYKILFHNCFYFYSLQVSHLDPVVSLWLFIKFTRNFWMKILSESYGKC